MKEETIKWARDMVGIIDNLIERMKNNTATDKSIEDTANMLLQLDHDMRKEPDYFEPEYPEEYSSIPGITSLLHDMYDSMTSRNIRMLRAEHRMYYQTLALGAPLEFTKEEALLKIYEEDTGRFYFESIADLPPERFQETVKHYKERLGAKYDPEWKRWYLDKDWPPEELIEKAKAEGWYYAKETEKPESPDKASGKEPEEKPESPDKTSEKETAGEPESPDTASGKDAEEKPESPDAASGKEAGERPEAPSQASGKEAAPVEIRLPYMRPETFKEVKDEIKKMGAKFDGSKKAWYMEHSDAETKMDALQKYLDSHDDAVYLQLPEKMTPKQFKEVTSRLKQDGARYNPDKKAWYITDRNPAEKFAEYLPSGSAREKEAAAGEKKDTAEKTKSPGIDENRRFKAVFYDNSERREVFSYSKMDAIDAIKRHLAPAPVSRFLDAKELTGKERCYIQELDADGKYKEEGIYLVASGRDVTPIEIRLPYMRPETFKEVKDEIKKMGAKFDGSKKAWYMERSNAGTKMDALQSYLAGHDDATYLHLPEKMTPEQFKEVTSRLKQDGARYNPDRKAWYITDRNPAEKFAEYLPSGSIHEKLENNKRTAAAPGNVSGKDRAMETRRQEQHIL